MTFSRRRKTFYVLFFAGVVFIVVGALSAFYNSVPVEVPIGNTVQPSATDILTPNMNVGNTANITVTGSVFSVTITDPDGRAIKSGNDLSDFHHVVVAKKDGEHKITVRNTGNSQLAIEGSAYTKGNPIAFSGQIMLVVTGVIITGLSLRLRG
ncbi:MAG: hypothetical protein M3297_06215 [Thermoproteota archaeon]|jgi:hypothetical protein|nr:hypothetical protein [Thermoproteota archaeon]